MNRSTADAVPNFLALLPSLEVEDLPENDRDCSICKEPYTSGGKVPVALPYLGMGEAGSSR